MASARISQSELARRIGMSQPTINRLLKGQAYGTAHLHRIARILGTTPAYLTGETDDPTTEAPDLDPLTSNENDLLYNFRALNREGQAVASRVIKMLASGSGALLPITSASDQEHVAIPPEPALAEMFQALLRAPQTKGKSGDALAHGLARLLPSGLRRVQGPLRIEQTDIGDERAEQRGDQQRSRPGQRQASRK